ncbi:MAG: TA system VapC family ribonuclease toxin [Chthoniobacterales bacterium]
MKPALLDTNVLLALAWPSHQHHAAAHNWFRSYARRGWASCAVTQLGFVRLSSNPSYTPDAVSPREAAELLSAILKHKGHKFWPSPAAAAPTLYASALGYQQVNDAWLVAVALRQRASLATFDTRLPVHARGSEVVILIPTEVAE